MDDKFVTLFAKNRKQSAFIVRDMGDGKAYWSYTRSPGLFAFVLEPGELPPGYTETVSLACRQMCIYLTEEQRRRIVELSGNNVSEWIRKAIDKAWNER